MELPPAIENSVEKILHDLSPQNKLLIFEDGSVLKEVFQETLGHRAVGVVYDPDYERGNYVPSVMSDRYDAFIFLDETKALNPLHITPDGGKMPDTYPIGI